MTFPNYEGKITHIPSGTVIPSTISTGFATCSDISGNFQSANPLFIEKWIRKPGTITSDRSLPGWVFWSEGAVMVAQPNFSGHLALTPPPDETAAITNAAARKNPSGPSVDVPVFLSELRDLPHMAKEAFASRSKKKPPTQGHNSVLEWNFGWEQLYRDIVELFNFTKHVDSKVATFKQLASKGWCSSGPVNIWSDSAEATGSLVTFHSTEGTVQGYYHTRTIGRRWGSARWIVQDPNTFPRTAKDQAALAGQIVHGWRLSPATVWQALPWSWLVDYFVNIGDYLEATRNTIGAELDGGCCMTHFETCVSQIVTVCPTWFSVRPGSLTVHWKERSVGNVGIQANVGFLSPRRLVNLVSLAQNFRSHHH